MPLATSLERIEKKEYSQAYSYPGHITGVLYPLDTYRFHWK